MRGTFFKYALCRVTGIALCTLPVASAVLAYFPLWQRRGGDAALSGFCVLLLALAAVPLMKLLRRSVSSISAHTVWFVLFAVFFVASKIADEMTVISFVGFVGNLVGAALFRLAEKYKAKKLGEVGDVGQK